MPSLNLMPEQGGDSYPPKYSSADCRLAAFRQHRKHGNRGVERLQRLQTVASVNERLTLFPDGMGKVKNGQKRIALRSAFRPVLQRFEAGGEVRPFIADDQRCSSTSRLPFVP